MKNTTRTLNSSIAVALIISFSLAAPAKAADPESFLIRIPYKSPYQLREISKRGIDVINFSPRGFIDVSADRNEMKYLFSTQHNVSVIASSGMSLSSLALDANLGLYHTYAEMESTLTALASLYPSLARTDILGTSYEGRNIYSIKISDNVIIDEDEPEVLIMGNHHARELMSVEIPLKFAQYLLSNYGVDSTATYLVDNREIFLVPMVNPDGHVYVENNHGGAWWTWWRKNRRNSGDGTFGVDLNRNYSYKWGYDNFGSSPNTSSQVYRGPGPFSEGETQAVDNLAQNHSFSLAFSYHSYGELLLCPWGYKFGYTQDHDLFYALGDTLTSSNGYAQGNAVMGIIYITNGDTDDWAYGESTTKNSFPCFTPEVNSYADGGFGPPETLINPTFNLLLPMNILALQLADNPRRILGPMRPLMYPITPVPYVGYSVSWNSGTPGDPNMPASYDLIEYKNLSSIVDHADTLSSLWAYYGFSLGARAYEGPSSYYSGTGNSLSNTQSMSAPLLVENPSDSFTCWVWYDIESNYDYVYLEATKDDGLTWETISGNITTNYNPYGSNHGNGITGSSSGWVKAIFPLSPYYGLDVKLRFHYITDGSVYDEGFYVDLINKVPSYERLTIVASSIADTSYTVNPNETGTFTYMVRSRDADNDLSFWSNLESFTVDNLVASRDVTVFKSYLGANYPNPFNPQTTIPYVIGGENGQRAGVGVSLNIYNVRGQIMRTLVNTSKAPGLYKAHWDGKNDLGLDVASGVYFARLVIKSSGVFTKKLVLLR